MNPFERFLELKQLIEGDPAIMKSLQAVGTFHKRSRPPPGLVKFIKAGDHNEHYRLGKVGEVWLATREHDYFLGYPDLQKEDCEAYVKRCTWFFTKGKRVVSVCGGVHSMLGTIERYFLIVEDLTAGGARRIKDRGGPGNEWGTIQGKRVYYDLETANETITQYTFMVTQNMIELNP